MLLTWLIIFTCILFAFYRVRVLRERGVPLYKALGVALDHRPIANLAAGAVISGVAMTAIFWLEWSLGFLQVSQVNSWTALIHDFGSSIAIPLQEEFLFRCALLGGLFLLIPRSWIGVAVSAAVFGGGHALNANASPLSVLITTLHGVILGIAFLATERIWLPLGLHFGWNYFQSWVFGFSMSGYSRGNSSLIVFQDIGPAPFTGGAYGPEGGIIGLGSTLLIFALVAAWLLFERHRVCGTEKRNAAANNP
jgi:membrane protease YdiL (CAAX protease family)